MTEETQEPEVQIESEPVAESEPVQPQESTFTQSELNKIVAREVAKAKRSVKKAQPSTQQEPSISTEQTADPRLDIVLEKLAAFEEANKAKEQQSAFLADVAGLHLSDVDKDAARVLHGASPDLFAKFIADRKSADAPPAPQGPGFSGIPAPNAIPTSDRQTNPIDWTQEDIAVMRKNGTFLKRVNEYKAGLPGGAGGLFPVKNPIKK